MVGESNGFGWSKHKVSNLIEEGTLRIDDGYRVRRAELGPTGIPFVRGGDIGLGEIRTVVEDHIRPELADRVQKKIAKPFDVAFISKGTVGRVGMLRPGQPDIVFAPQVCYWRAIDRTRINPRYLFYLMTSHEFQSELNAVMTHGSMVADYVSLSDQRNFELTFPPIKIQDAIASILGALDDKIELNRRMNATLESIARAIFKSWFVDFDPVRAKSEGRKVKHSKSKQAPSLFNLPSSIIDLFPSTFEDSELGKIPTGWSTSVLDDITEIVIGGDWGKEVPQVGYTEAVRCIRGADIPDLQNGDLGKMPLRYIKASSLAKRALQHGDIAFEISGGSPTQSTGRPVLVTQTLLDRLPTPLTCSNFCRLVRFKNEVSPYFTYSTLRWQYEQEEFLQYENGTTGIKNLAFKTFSSLHRFLLPPTEVLAEFDRVMSRHIEKLSRNGVESATLSTLRDTLLPKLLSGELPVPAALTATEEALANG